MPKRQSGNGTKRSTDRKTCGAAKNFPENGQFALSSPILTCRIFPAVVAESLSNTMSIMLVFRGSKCRRGAVAESVVQYEREGTDRSVICACKTTFPQKPRDKRGIRTQERKKRGTAVRHKEITAFGSGREPARIVLTAKFGRPRCQNKVSDASGTFSSLSAPTSSPRLPRTTDPWTDAPGRHRLSRQKSFHRIASPSVPPLPG